MIKAPTSNRRKDFQSRPDAGCLKETPCTCHMLRRTARQLTRYYDQALKPAGLSLTQYSVLANTRHATSLTITMLAEILDLERTTLTRNLQPLILAGWIEVGQGSDKRSRAVKLTESGTILFNRAKPLWQQAEATFRDNMGRDDATHLRSLLDEAARAGQTNQAVST
jgi:DNA-binding MarR family transcriptional regulator